MSAIIEQIANIRREISLAEQQFHREKNSVKLLAVTKSRSIKEIEEAIAAGQHYFGENYVQEALPKIRALANDRIEWHFIGVVQSNKTKDIAQNFHWVHSISRYKIAKRLNDQRSVDLPRLNICIEINVNDEKNKSGISLSELPELAMQIVKLPRLKLRGLMTIPSPENDFDKQRIPYHQLQLAWKDLQNRGLTLDTLSMGMTNDFKAAIAEGSTCVRIGRGIFESGKIKDPLP